MEYVKVKALRGGGFWWLAANDPRLATGEFELYVEPTPEPIPEPTPDPPIPESGNQIGPYDTPRMRRRR